jgi:hypothetical protein
MTLIRKDVSFNWVQPTFLKSKGAKSDENIILLKRMVKEEHNVSWNSKLLDFKKAVLEKYWPTLTMEGVHKVAFSIDSGKFFIVFDPPKGIPFFILSKNGNGKALNNNNFIDMIYEKFKLDKKKSKYFLKIGNPLERDDLTFYNLTILNYLDRLPIFESDIYPEQ